MKNTYEDDEKELQAEKARFLKALDAHDARTKCDNLLEPMRQKIAKLESERTEAITWLVLVKSGIPHWKAYEYAELALKALQGKS
jgi:hypothetical protein